MKTTPLNSFTKNILPGIFAVTIVLMFVSCTKSLSFLVSSVVPAARGNVKVTTDKNKNYVIDIHLFNLAEVERLQSSGKSYVAWMVTDQEMTQNIGKLKSSTSLFSKQLKASLKTVSSSKPIKIFITAEDDPGAQYPGTPIVISTDRSQN
jgi:hypothetical protein